MEGSIKASVNYAKAQQLLESDALYAKHFGVSVGGGSSSRTIRFHDVIRALIKPFLGDNHLPQYDQERFSETLSAIHKDFDSSLIVTEEITPLFGFHSEEKVISLGDRLTIEELPVERIGELLKRGTPIAFHLNAHHASMVYSFAIKRTKITEKTFGGLSGHRENETISDDLIISALQLYKRGTVFPVTRLSRTLSFFGAGEAFSHGAFRPGLESTYRLSSAESKNFLKLWEQILPISSNLPKYLKVALRRFSQARLRPDTEDRIIDLLIAAEAVFLSSDGGNYQGEIKYRLAHRAALFLGETSDEKRNVFETFKQAYNVRSAIVHGSTQKLPARNGEKAISLSDFENSIAVHIQRAIIKIIQNRPDLEKIATIDWDGLIFPDTETPGSADVA